MSGSKARDRVPVAPLREAFLVSGLSASTVAVRLGRTLRDSSLVNRSLGIAPRKTSDGVRYYASDIGPDQAKAICDVIGRDFDELYPVIPSEPLRGGVCQCGEHLARPAPGGKCGFCVEEAKMQAEMQGAAA